MKTINKISKLVWFLLLGLLVFASSCVKDDNFDAPASVIPSFTLASGDTLITIQQLKATHLAGSLDTIRNNYVIRGIVTGNDEFGNIYKTLYIQDTTAGIVLSINYTNLYNEYKQGQVLYVKCKGMVLADYGGTPQLGAVYQGGAGQLPGIYMSDHFFNDGRPGAVPAPKVIDASGLTPANLSMLVRFDSCSFVDAGQTYVANNLTTDRSLTIKGGATVIVRTSNYAAFKNAIMPSGKGTVIGMLSVYNGTYQLAIRNINDVFGFITPIAEANFITDPLALAAPNTWTTQDVNGTQAWSYDAAYKYMKVSGYSGSNFANEDWLISPSYTTVNTTSAILSFNHAAKFGSPSTELHVMISTNYNGTNFGTANWTELTVPNWPSGADWNFINSGDIDLSSYLGQSNIHIAFKYTSTTSSGATWEVKGLSIRR